MTNSVSVDVGRNFAQQSSVTMVLALLKIDVRELIRAANIAASIRPRKPVGDQRVLHIMILGSD